MASQERQEDPNATSCGPVEQHFEAIHAEGEPIPKKPKLSEENNQLSSVEGQGILEDPKFELSAGKETIKLFEINFSEFERDYFVESLFIPFGVTEFVVTKRFREVIDRINNHEAQIAISGPKGVGKSMALAAIATLCHEKGRQCFLWSPAMTGINGSFLGYFSAISKYEGGEFKNIYKCVMEVVKFLESTDKPLVLIELGSFASYEELHEQFLVTFMARARNRFQTVISLSSGEGLFSCVKGTFSRQIGLIRLIHSTDLIPFTKTEFEIYKGLYDLRLESEQYNKLTNYNPLLLTHLRGIGGETNAAGIIKTEVTRLVNKIFESADMNKIGNDLSFSVDMLVNAFSNTVLEIDVNWIKYVSSWVHKEHIAYVKEQDENAGTFVLSLNFPTTFLDLMVALNKALKESKISIKDDLVDGLIFEARVCEELQWSKLSVLYSSKDEKVACQDDLETITFTFNTFSRKSPNSPVQSLAKGVLTQLRPKHPVIDAVAYVVVEQEPWLLLIQVSLNSYKGHDKKLEHLLESNAKSCECKSNKNKASSWIDYYRKLIKDEVKCMYIYISPKEIHEKSPDTIFHEYNLRLKDQPEKSVFYGVVLKDSESATMVNKLECKVRSID